MLTLINFSNNFKSNFFLKPSKVLNFSNNFEYHKYYLLYTLLKTLHDSHFCVWHWSITHKMSFNPTSDSLLIPMDTCIMVLWCGMSYMYYSSPAASRQSLMVYVNAHGAALALIYAEALPICHVKRAVFLQKTIQLLRPTVQLLSKTSNCNRLFHYTESYHSIKHRSVSWYEFYYITK